MDLYGKRDMIISSVWDKLWINPDLIGFNVMHTELGVWVDWLMGSVDTIEIYNKD